MKKLLAIICVFVFSANTVSAAAFVQAASSYGAGASPQTKAFSSNVTAGNLIAVYYQNLNGTDISPTVTDTLGNTYTKAAFVKSVGVNPATGFLYYAKNILGGANTVSVTAGDGSDHGIHIMEISGLDTTDPFVASTTGIGTGTSPSAPDLTTGFAGFIYVGGGQETNVGSNTAGSGYTIGTQETGHNSFDEYQVVTAGTYTVTATTPSGTWVLLGMAFKNASAPASTYRPRSIFMGAASWVGNYIFGN
jgi:hypothetical protein